MRMSTALGGRRASRRFALHVALWTAIGLFFATQTHVDHAYSGHPLTWGQSLSLALLQWYLWALLAPLVFFLSRRFPFERGRVGRALAVHGAAVVVLAVTKLAADSALAPRIVGVPSATVPLATLHLNVLTYAAIVGASHAIDYYRRFREREVRAAHAEARLAEARLAVLRTQLQPHFLFNTLHAISSLVRVDPDAADAMIARLSDLLRVTLESGGADEVPLRREIDVLRRYVEIEEVRFQDRLRVRYEIDPETLDAAVPSLVLQPLVENAIRHGVARLARPGTVAIRSSRDGARLRLEVGDDGPGAAPDAKPGRGLGLDNSRNRLAELYGADHRFAVSTREGGGFRVTIEIPLRATADGAAP